MAEAQQIEIVDVPFDKFFDTVVDFNGYPRFVTGVSSSQTENLGPNKVRAKVELEMIKKLFYVIEVEFQKNADSAEVNWKLVDSDLLKKNNGSWKIVSKGNGKTEVTYKLEVEFKITVPGLILKGLIKKSLPQAIKEFYLETKRRIN